jgi:hypothetical protein
LLGDLTAGASCLIKQMAMAAAAGGGQASSQLQQQRSAMYSNTTVLARKQYSNQIPNICISLQFLLLNL